MTDSTAHVLTVLRQRGSLTTLEALDMGLGIRLAARVEEIRRELGASCIETVWETSGDKRWARYRWVGVRDPQVELFAS